MKKKIFMLALAACMIVLSVAGSSLAYFTDTDARSNVFTTGKVDISLDYSNVTTTNLFPGKTYDDNATITVTSDSETAYVGAILKFAPNTSYQTIKTVFQALEATGKTVKYANDTTNNVVTIYVVFNAEVAKGNTVTIFDKIAIPATWDHAQMAAFKGLNMTITAYATQTVGFGNAEAALTTAFGNTINNDAGNADWAGYGDATLAPNP